MDYFADLFGTPEVTRRENWDGKEEPVKFVKLVDNRPLVELDHTVEKQLMAEAIRQAWNRDTTDPNSNAYGMPSDANTIDIDHEAVD